MRTLLQATALGLALTLTPVGTVLAASVLPTPTPTPVAAPSVEQSRRMNTLKMKGASEIDRRLDQLQKASDKVALVSRLSKTESANIKSQLSSEIDRLTKLKTKLANETNLAATRVDIQTLIDEYPTYGLLAPKARIIASADRFLLADSEFQTLRSQLQHKINLAKQQGKDVTALQKSLDDMRLKLASAKPKYDGLTAKLIDLPTASYPASSKVLMDSYNGLKTARIDLAAAYTDAKSILDGLGDLKSATPTPSPSLSPSARPTPAR